MFIVKFLLIVFLIKALSLSGPVGFLELNPSSADLARSAGAIVHPDYSLTPFPLLARELPPLSEQGGGRGVQGSGQARGLSSPECMCSSFQRRLTHRLCEARGICGRGSPACCRLHPPLGSESQPSPQTAVCPVP